MKNRNFHSGLLEAGEHTFVWNAGENVCAAPGAYECIIRSNGRVRTLPVMVVR